MSVQPKSYKVDPDSELGRVVKEAASSHQPILVDTGEAVYRVAADQETSTQLPLPTAEEVAASIEGIKQAIGAWTGLIDAEAYKSYIYDRHKTKNRTSVGL